MMPDRVFTDGGTIGKNPSRDGGSWAFVFTYGNVLIGEASGLIRPEMCGLPTVTCNVAELWAAVEAMESLPDGWHGEILTDSSITKGRICPFKKKPSYANVPPDLKARLLIAKARLGKFKATLIAGHPTDADLASGRSAENGNPVSLWNVRCDLECQRITAGGAGRPFRPPDH